MSCDGVTAPSRSCDTASVALMATSAAPSEAGAKGGGGDGQAGSRNAWISTR